MSYQRRETLGIATWQYRITNGMQIANTATLKATTVTMFQPTADSAKASANQTASAAARLTASGWRCASTTYTHAKIPVTALADRLPSALRAMNAVSWSSARNT